MLIKLQIKKSVTWRPCWSRLAGIKKPLSFHEHLILRKSLFCCIEFDRKTSFSRTERDSYHSNRHAVTAILYVTANVKIKQNCIYIRKVMPLRILSCGFHSIPCVCNQLIVFHFIFKIPGHCVLNFPYCDVII